MADFNDKRIRRLVEADGLIATATAEDLALLMVMCTKFKRIAMKRIEDMSLLDDIQLDPAPLKPPKGEE